MSRWMLGVALLALSAGCRPTARELQFRCEPETELCPDGMQCLPFGLNYFCQIAENSVCGNGVLEPGEQCDATDLAKDVCDALGVPGGQPHCVFPVCKIYCSLCGNGVVDLGELCDDQNTTAGDGCSPTCQTEYCGNGVLDPGEQCDDGPGNSALDPAACSLECTHPAAEVLVSGGMAPRFLVLSSTHLYWFEDGSGILRMPLAGGPVEPLHPDFMWADDLAVQGGYIYWVNNEGELRRMTTTGEAETTLASGLGSNLRLVVDDSHAYVGGPSTTTLAKVPLEGGAPVTLASDSVAFNLALDVGHLYWTWPSSHTVSRIAKSGGAPTVLTAQDPSYGIAVDRTHAYFTTTTGLWKVPVEGGSPSLLASLGEWMDVPVQRIALDESYVYLLDPGPDLGPGLMRIPLDGGEPQLLAPVDVAISMDGYIAVNATHVYFSTDMAIYRVPK